MTQKKIFWLIIALISGAAAIFSGWKMYNLIDKHFSDNMPAASIKTNPPPPIEPEEEKPVSEEKTPQESSKTKAVKTLFEYKDQKAKNVFVAGAFTSWKEVKMSKKDGLWKAEIYILPGTYTYHFIVDGNKKKDPGKPSSPAGDSVITVINP